MAVKLFCEHGWFITGSSFEEVMATAVDMYADTQTGEDYIEADKLVREDYELGLIMVFGVGGDYAVH